MTKGTLKPNPYFLISEPHFPKPIRRRRTLSNDWNLCLLNALLFYRSAKNRSTTAVDNKNPAVLRGQTNQKSRLRA
jgi:hypothetical protein